MRFKLLIFVLFLAFIDQVLAEDPHFRPIRDISQLPGAWENARFVDTSAVIVADYNLIRKDFPFTESWSRNQIDTWLVLQTSWMSVPQSLQTNVNGPIKTTDVGKEVFRPKEYGRGFVIPVDENKDKPDYKSQKNSKYLIDIKGSGSQSRPYRGDHSDGLMPLYSALYEYKNEKQISNIIANFYPSLKTVGTYAILDLGFSMSFAKIRQVPVRAGLLLRQAHVRHYNRQAGDNRTMPSVLPEELQLKYELALRRFGFTFTSHRRIPRVMNVQGTASGAIVDFGSVQYKAKYSGDIYSYYRGGDHEGEVLMVAENSKDWKQPDPKIMVPESKWQPGLLEAINPLTQPPDLLLMTHGLKMNGMYLASSDMIRNKAERYLQKTFYDYSQSICRLLFK